MNGIVYAEQIDSSSFVFSTADCFSRNSVEIARRASARLSWAGSVKPAWIRIGYLSRRDDRLLLSHFRRYQGRAVEEIEAMDGAAPCRVCAV